MLSLKIILKFLKVSTKLRDLEIARLRPEDLDPERAPTCSLFNSLHAR